MENKSLTEIQIFVPKWYKLLCSRESCWNNCWCQWSSLALDLLPSQMNKTRYHLMYGIVRFITW